MTDRRAALALTLQLICARADGRSESSVAQPRGFDRGPLEGIDWHGFVAFTSAHFVLQAMAGPLTEAAKSGADVPDDLLLFVDEMQAANGRRNVRLGRALEDIAGRLNALGIVPVALKGAAFLLEDGSADAAWRFMSDVDLLVPPERLADCVSAIEAMGFRTATADYDPANDAHFPPLISPCRQFSVELHTRLFGRDDFGIDPRRLEAESSHVRHGSACIRVPALGDRIAHLVAHAQLHNRNHAGKRLVLKDVLDLAMMPREAVIRFECADAARVFAEPRHRTAALALLAAWRRCLGIEAGVARLPSAERWAAHAIDRLGWPPWRSTACLPWDVLGLELHRLMRERGHFGRRMAQLGQPQKLIGNGQAWAFKQRQRLWS